jgi:hypothetical protein
MVLQIHIYTGKDGQKFDISGIGTVFLRIQDIQTLHKFLQVISLVYMKYILFFPSNLLQ